METNFIRTLDVQNHTIERFWTNSRSRNADEKIGEYSYVSVSEIVRSVFISLSARIIYANFVGLCF